VDPVQDPLLLRISGSAENRTRDLWICSQELWPLDHRGDRVALFYKRKINQAGWHSGNTLESCQELGRIVLLQFLKANAGMVSLICRYHILTHPF
jgi:hypothetical protein